VPPPEWSNEFDELDSVAPLTLTFELHAPDTSARFGLITVPLTKR
jgi:hypothetical protein